MRNTVILIGSGKLAESMHRGLPENLPGYSIDTWENRSIYSPDQMVVVHIGSGRQITDAEAFCKKHKVPMIQASTGITAENHNHDFTYIDAPNLNILMLKFMFMLKESGHLYKNYRISVTESHQESKKTVPGTAMEMAGALGVDSTEIRSIRDHEIQKEIYGIPEESLSLHAFHEITIEEGDTAINFRTLVNGHESYITGIAAVISCLPELQNRYYHILELVELKML